MTQKFLKFKNRRRNAPSRNLICPFRDPWNEWIRPLDCSIGDNYIKFPLLFSGLTKSGKITQLSPSIITLHYIITCAE
jgi:hypothetical protein